MEVLESQLNNCSTLTIDQAKKANIINSVISAVTFLILLVFLALLLLYRAFRTTLQRLFLYLTIITALDAMVTTLNIELQFDVDSRLCGVIGFATAWLDVLIDLFNLAFTLYLISTAYQRFRGRELKWLGSCRNHHILTEILSVVLIVVFPLSYIWVPAVHHTYGIGETLCWIKTYDQDCHEEVNNSRTDSTLLESIVVALHFTIILSFTTLIIFISMLVIKLRRSRKESLETVGRAIFLIAMTGIAMCIRVGQFATNIAMEFFHKTVNDYLYDAIDNSALYASNLMILLGFAVYLYSPKKLKLKALKKAAKQWACCQHCHTHHSSRTKEKQTRSDPVKSGIIDEDGLVSVESSVEQDVPSHTTGYSSPYTNEFTDITEIVDYKTSPKYGSINVL